MEAKIRSLELAANLTATASNIERVAAQTDLESAAWAFTQWRLRERGRVKFKLADQMLFAAEALEQSTNERVAEYHASCFPKDEEVIDMTCGIGGDLIALAKRGPAIGYELDPERAQYARHNLSVHGLQATVNDFSSLLVPKIEFAFADPARRVAGTRTLRLEEFQPNPTVLRDKLIDSKLSCIKLSPMLKDSDIKLIGDSVEFISYGRECREALVYLGSEAIKGQRAVRIETGSRLEAGSLPPVTEISGNFIFEADPAAIRAHCLGTLCKDLGLEALGDSNGYLTGDTEVKSEWLASYCVLAENLSHEKAIRFWLRAHRARLSAVKTRCPGVDPQAMMKQLRTPGNKEVILFAYPLGLRKRFVIATL